MNSGIVWLASYPKSGNTWFRTFLSNLLSEEGQEVNINHLKTDGIFSSRMILDSVSGIETSNLTADEIDRLRPAAYNYLAQSSEKQLFIKVHDAFTYLDEGTPLLGTVNCKAIYFIRNPLDVAVSFANHAAIGIDSIINRMANGSFAFCDVQNRLANQFRQKLLTWSLHVESWVYAREIPVHLVKYEDMQLEPVKTFTEAIRFIGLTCTDQQIRRAIELSDFKILKAQEEQNGFKEKLYNTPSFFRAGETGDWRNHLSDQQRDQIISDHETTMRKFGYLDDRGKLVF